MNILKTNIENCSACGSSNLKHAVRMDNLPHVGVFLRDRKEENNYPFVDNNLNICMDCGHAQLSYALDPGFLYNTSFQHCTSCSMSAKQANDWLFDFITSTVEKDFKVVAEIGINDSYFLQKFAETSEKVIGVDPDGFDMRKKEKITRYCFDHSINDAKKLRGIFVKLHKIALKS